MKRKLETLMLAGAVALVSVSSAWAQQSIEDRLDGMEKRIRYLESRVAAQDRVIVEKDRKIAELTERQESSWVNGLEIGGAVEVEAVREKPSGESDTSSASVATAEVAIAAQVNDWVGSELVLAYDGDAEKVDVDTATVTFSGEGPFAVTAGKLTLPFGVYETNLVSDPLTLEFAETADIALVAEMSSGAFNGSIFGLHGSGDDLDNFGVAAGFALEDLDLPVPASLGGNFSYIREILSDSVIENVIDAELSTGLSGWAASVTVGFGDASLSGEYVASLDRVTSSKPTSRAVEAAYGLDVLGTPLTVALGYSTTSKAVGEGFDLGLPESRFLAGLAIELTQQVGLALEWRRDRHYSIAAGGTGGRDTALTGVLSLEF